MEPTSPSEWIEYQPKRRREKEFHDIMLRDGTIVECCYPNGVHFTCFVKGKHAGRAFADYRVVKIRLCAHPLDREDID